jgi:hypothetical protein
MPEARIAALTAGDRPALQSDPLQAPAGTLMGYGRRVCAWTADDIPDQRGRPAIVTGANTGVSYPFG